MLSQFLAFGEAEEHRARAVGAQECAAHNAMGGKLGFSGQVKNFLRLWIYQWLLCHNPNLCQAFIVCFDVSQGSLRFEGGLSVVRQKLPRQ